MKNKGLVSIVIPIYNVEKYAIRCLESINKQTYKNIEVICINDGSIDNSYHIVKEYLKKCSFQYIIKNCENKGVSAARNLGIKLSSGDYICFVDSDDMIDNNYITHMVSVLERFPDFECAICKKRDITDNDKIGDIPSCEEKLLENRIKETESIFVLRKMLYHQISAGIWNLMISKELILKNNLYFEEGFAYSEDLQLVWKLVACSKGVVTIDERLYLYRQRDSSAMAKFDNRRMDGLILFQNLEKFLKKNRKDFSKEFSRFGVAYWVWSTLWQAARLANGYDDFIEKANILHYKEYLPKLYEYPIKKVSISSKIAMISLKGYYILIKIYLKVYN